MGLKKNICGNERERMPNLAFRIMSVMMKTFDLFSNPGKRLEDFGIKKGDTVIDYGCGPARYIKKASRLVGVTGKVYGADIHELSIADVNKVISKYNLKNVMSTKINGYHCPLDNNIADLIYAMDMFHMISDSDSFLDELHRLLKKDGVLIIEDGHQPRARAKEKILNSKKFNVIEENKKFQRCTPI